MEYGNSVGGFTGVGSMSTASATLNATPKPISEFEREANRLASAIDYGQKLVQELHGKLTPILKTLPSVGSNAEKSVEPQTQHGQFLAVSANRVATINEVLSQLLASIEI